MVDHKKIEKAVRLLLEGIGEDVTREGLADTPDRIARMYEEIYKGMAEDPAEHLSRTFAVESNEIVLEKDITFYSTCEHHLMPFYGKAHIAYLPDGRVAGLSKLARTVEVYARTTNGQDHLSGNIRFFHSYDCCARQSCNVKFANCLARHMDVFLRALSNTLAFPPRSQ